MPDDPTMIGLFYGTDLYMLYHSQCYIIIVVSKFDFSKL